MTDTDVPIINIASYRLDIYRLLTLLLADKQIAENDEFKCLAYDDFDTELHRLLTLIAVFTRQLLEYIDNMAKRIKKDLGIDIELKNRPCGDFWANFAAKENPPKLGFEKACSMLIHASKIVARPYYYKEGSSQEIPEQRGEYFKGKITITGDKKSRAEIDFQKFAQYCIKLSDKITKRG